MKTKITTTIAIALIFITTLLKAQDEKYIGAMKTGMQLFSTAKSGADFTAASNHFERVGGIAKTEWLPFYYAAYTQMINGTTLQDAAQKDLVYDKALELIGKAEILKPAESEIAALKGYITFMKIYVDPMTRMQSGMGQAMASLEKAKALNPNNPRPYFIIAQNQFYTPEAYGGGKKVAKSGLEMASAKFETFKADGFAPSWGKDQNQALLEQCK